jgi:hypothetical protein
MSQSSPTDVEANTYAECWVLYGVQTDAYRAAFPDSKANPKVHNEKACTFHKIGKVQERIAELQERAREIANEGFDISASDLKKTLSEVMEAGLEDIDGKRQNLGAVVSAVSEVNRMDGNHAPTKVGVGGLDDMPPVTVITRRIIKKVDADS